MLEIVITPPSFSSAVETMPDPRIRGIKPFETRNPEGNRTIGYHLSVNYENGVVYPLSVIYYVDKDRLEIVHVPSTGLLPNFPDEETVSLELWCRDALRVYDPDAHLYFLKNGVGQLSFTLQWYYLKNHTAYELEGWISDVMNFLPSLAAKINEFEE